MLGKLVPSAEIAPYAGHAGYAAAVESVRPGVNIGVLAGHGTIRKAASGSVDRQLSDGEMLCEIELAQGALPIAAPFSCRMMCWNGALAGDPAPVWTDPYGAGWIAEIDAAGAPAPGGLLTAAEARKQAEMDLRGFRRRAALYLLADTAEVGTCLADGGRMITDMRQLLGKERYLQLLREMTA